VTIFNAPEILDGAFGFSPEYDATDSAYGYTKWVRVTQKN